MQTIPLNKLDPSEENVRKEFDDNDLETFSHDIEHHGQLQNFIVKKSKKRGRYEVIAGERRRRSMLKIVDRKVWQKDHPVFCLVWEGEYSAYEISTAENIQRKNMKPTEECTAFVHFIKKDGDAAAVAKRFGFTEQHVKGRVRLANLAPPIFEALDNEEITLDVGKAFASTADTDAQLRAWEQVQNMYHVNADSVRRIIAQDTIRGNSPVALLVGEKAYVKAGGRIESDLFSEEVPDRWLDVNIAHDLAGKKLETEAKRVAKKTGFGWIKPVAGTSCYSIANDMDLFHVHVPSGLVSEESQERIDAINDRLDEIETIYDNFNGEDDSVDIEKIDKEAEELEDERHALLHPEAELPDDIKADIGRFLKLDKNGQMILDDDFYSEKEIELAPGENGEIELYKSEDRSTGTTASPKKPDSPEAAAPGGKPISAKLFDELSMQRRDILSACLIEDPGLALDYGIYTLADSRGLGSTGSSIRLGTPNNPISGEVPGGMAEDMIADAYEALNKSWQENDTNSERFLAFRDLSDEEKAAWLAYVVATSLEPKNGFGSAYNPIHGVLGSLLEINVADFWRPNEENYFDRVAKASSIAALEEVGGTELSSRYAKSKKPELSSSAAKLFAGETIVEKDVKERAVQWLPETMKFQMPTFKAEAEEEAAEPQADGHETSSDQTDDAEQIEQDEREAVDA